MRFRLIAGAAALLLLPSFAQSAEVRLLASGALRDAYLELLPDFEKTSGHKVTAAWSSTTDIRKRVAAVATRRDLRGDLHCNHCVESGFVPEGG